jgi:hypothetical protein
MADNEDFLDEDKEIPSQKYGVFSFISPERVLKRKDVFYMSEFLKYLCSEDEIVNIVLDSNSKKMLDYDKVKEKYDDFIFKSEEKLETKFHELENFKTTVRGFKARGNYSTLREAEVRASVLRKQYKNDNIFVGQVGYWLPFDPNPDRIENQEYAQEELNTLMKKYKENCANRDIHYQQEKEEKLKQVNKPKEEKEESQNLFSDKDPWLEKKLNNE